MSVKAPPPEATTTTDRALVEWPERNKIIKVSWRGGFSPWSAILRRGRVQVMMAMMSLGERLDLPPAAAASARAGAGGGGFYIFN